MVNRKSLLMVAAAALLCLHLASCNPSIVGGYDLLSICMQNCAQCKKMYGRWFEGQRCAEACLVKRTDIPDCENPDSIAPFIIRV